MDAPSGANANDAAAAMVWDEARRMLARQEAALDALRTQAIALLSVASVVAGLFGSRFAVAHPSGASAALVYTAAGVFGIVVLLAVWILKPRKWEFDQGLGIQLDKLRDGIDVPAGALAMSWARGVETQRCNNQRQLDCLMRGFSRACVLAGLSVVLWGLALGLS